MSVQDSGPSNQILAQGLLLTRWNLGGRPFSVFVHLCWVQWATYCKICSQETFCGQKGIRAWGLTQFTVQYCCKYLIAFNHESIREVRYWLVQHPEMKLLTLELDGAPSLQKMQLHHSTAQSWESGFSDPGLIIQHPCGTSWRLSWLNAIRSSQKYYTVQCVGTPSTMSFNYELLHIREHSSTTP